MNNTMIQEFKTMDTSSLSDALDSLGYTDNWLRVVTILNLSCTHRTIDTEKIYNIYP